MTPTPDDRAAVVGVAYDRYAPSLYRYAVMLLADEAAAADAVQQVFTGWLRQAGTVADEERYLRRAVRNECFTMLRQRQRKAARTGALLEPIDRGAADSEQQVAIEQAVRALPPEQREVIHLKVYEGLTFSEIAEAIGESINTVASRYRYAIDKMRVHLAEWR
jgi:RNA polymerase sigma-70 factor (ECF subfamily)